MQQTQWVADLPDFVLFVIGLGGLAGALLLIVKLWKEFVPDNQSAMSRDISAIRSDVHDVRKRVGLLELDIAKIDQPAIARRFDTFEQKLDRLYDLLLERSSKQG